MTTKNGIKIDIPDSGVRKNNNVTFIDVKTKSDITAVTIPDGVTEIPNSAFLNYSLTNINIPDSVTIIEDYAFKACFSLESITIPDSVTHIGRQAFYDCGYSDGTAHLNLEVPDSVTTIGKYAFNHVNFTYSGPAEDTNHNNWGGNKIE